MRFDLIISIQDQIRLFYFFEGVIISESKYHFTLLQLENENRL